MSYNKKSDMLDITPMYCSGCRRFVGYESIRKGFAVTYCPRCKAWTVHIGRNTNLEKTMKHLKGFLDSLTTRTRERILRKGSRESSSRAKSPEESNKGNK